MIISPKYKFIFIKTQKTAGSSIEKILIDKIKDTDPNLIFGGMPFHNMKPINIKRKLAIRSIHSGQNFIQQHYPKEWKKYFKFTIERNYWDKVVSYFYWVAKKNPSRTNDGFKQFVINLGNLNFIHDWNLYSDNDNIVVDTIMQYDHLHIDLEKVFAHLSIPYDNEIQKVFLKSGLRPYKSYKDMYSDATKEIVYNFYIKPIKYFNYSF